jgi:hypothetical protein
MANEKLLRANVTVLLAYPEAFADPLHPSAAELNDQFVFTTNEDAMVFNVSCAIEDSSLTANFTDSDTDDERTICDEGAVQTPTAKNYEFSLDFFRDKNVDAAGLFNLGFRLVQNPDRPFYGITRIGVSRDTAFANGQDVSIFGLTTDNVQDIVDSGANTKAGARFQYTGQAKENYRLGSAE